MLAEEDRHNTARLLELVQLQMARDSGTVGKAEAVTATGATHNKNEEPEPPKAHGQHSLSAPLAPAPSATLTAPVVDVVLSYQTNQLGLLKKAFLLLSCPCVATGPSRLPSSHLGCYW